MLSAVLLHDRTLVVAGLVAVIALSWIWLLTGAGLHMDEMDMGGGQIMLMAPPWTPGYAVTIFIMWIVMMAASVTLSYRAGNSRLGTSRFGPLSAWSRRDCNLLSIEADCFPRPWRAAASFWPRCC
jgi:hypothetical protein